ncbi:MAG: sugar ABC transporter permease [Clostridia bacterium]|nr:sugar ABC transporter permease [Clostridia bacterium]
MSKNIDSESKIQVPDSIATKISFVIMGFGNLAHKQFVKGAAFLLIEVGYILFMVMGGLQNLWNMVTLGTVETHEEQIEGSMFSKIVFGDNSMLFLLFGIITLLITAAFVGFYRANIKSARLVQELEMKGEKIPTFVDDVKSLLDSRFHITLLFLPIVGIVSFSVVPLVYTIFIAFTNYDRDHQVPGKLFDWVGLHNFKEIIFGGVGFADKFSHTFFGVLGWTLVWAFFATFTNYFLGIIVAIIINQKGIKFKKLWRSVLVLTIAMPQFISLLVMRNFFSQYGVINRALINAGIISDINHAIPFFTNQHWARVSIIIVNMWVGIPYTMLMSSGILMNIPQDLYEAATVDGANKIQMFFKITLPQIIFVTTPYLITSFIGNINNFNLIYLMTGGGPSTTEYYAAGKTDLLVTWLYKLTSDKKDYSLASTIGILIFIVSATFSLLTYTNTKSYKEEDSFQ